MITRLALLLSDLRLRLREVRSFLRFPLYVPLVATAGGSAACVLLYGVPYADWNAPLSDATLWAGVSGVTSVVRLPALTVVSGLLARFVARGARQVVVPTKTGHAKHLPRGWRSLCPDAASIRALGDKRRFAAYMKANGLGDYCPLTYADPDDAAYPCVLKRADLSASWGVVVVHSRAELEAQRQSPVFDGHPYTLQALVPGSTEHATYCVCKNGAILWHCTFLTEVAAADTIKSEDSVLRRWKIETPAPIVREIESVLAPLAYDGPCNLDYKLGRDGRIKIFEINPRLGGSLMLPQYGGELRQALSCIVANAS